MKIAMITARGAERFYADNIFYEVENTLHRELIFLMEDMEWMPNLGLLTLAGAIDPSHEITYIDEEYLSKETMQQLLYEEDFDLACLSVINAQYSRSYEIAGIFRQRGIPVAMGGIHPTALPKETMRHTDYLFLGEAEDTFRQFLHDFEKGAAKKIYRAEKPVDLKTLPPPKFDLMRRFDYYKKYNRFPIQGTRGCPRKCDFCFLHKVYHPKHRTKTVSQLMNEVETVKDIVGEPFISFTDENMFVNPNFSIEFAKGMMDKEVLWECYCDVSAAENDELLSLLYDAHCTLLLIGFETLNPENLKNTNPWKQKQVDNYRRAIEKIQSKGVGVSGLFIVGFDNDTPEVFGQIRDFAYETGLVDVEVSALCPFPGTGLYNRLEKEGRIFCRDWSKYTWIHMNFQPMRMSAEETIQGLFGLFKDLTRLDRLIMQKKYFKKCTRRLYGKQPDEKGKPTFLK